MFATDAPFIDTSAADLTHRLGLDKIPALASLQVGDMELHVLGASHQVRVGDWSETVACLPGRPGHLPATIAGPGYTFASSVHTYEKHELAAGVQDLKARVEDDPNGLAVAFKGDDLALTAMTAAATAARLEWMTWHVYPQHGQIVTTRSWVDQALIQR
ncbi:hypothetical protein QF038_001600 [Pseudarthrobacter sp. W1I19]|uniref:DUF2617 family protein n=1 Tax=Pseudarthrobacter sp. W1I19 TaxID=3042288 RepID=UPI002788AD4C|nr:DUF2617 family protein [Pseudarthrobacter sp. W1I19]MDQ0923092.1 hypothetical protein [Pseudarthrobacter sp. W1I19]